MQIPRRSDRETAAGPLVVVTTVLMLWLGCGGEQTPPQYNAPPADEVEIDDVAEEFQEAAETLEAWTYDQSDDFAEWGQGRLDAIDLALGDLRTGIEDLGDDASAEWNARLQALEAERERLASELEAAGDSSEAAWDEIQSGFVAAQQELADSIERAAEELTATGQPEQETEKES